MVDEVIAICESEAGPRLALSEEQMSLEEQHNSSFASLARRTICLADAVEAMVEAVVVVDSTQSIVWMNCCAERLFGCSRTEMLGRSFRTFVSEGSPFIHTGDGILTGGNLDEGAPHGRSSGCPIAASWRRLNDARVHNKERGEISVEVYSSPVLLGDTTVELRTLRPIAVKHDNPRGNISPNVCSRAVEAMAHAVDDAVLITDADLSESGPRVLFANAASVRIFGHSPTEMLGKTPEFFQSPPMEPKLLDKHRSELAQGRTIHGELTLSRRDGSPLRIQRVTVPITDEEGKPTHFITRIRDLTDDHSRIRVIRETQEFLRATLDAIAAHVAVVSPSGAILAVNEAWMAFARSNGLPDADFIGANYFSTGCSSPLNTKGAQDAECARHGLQAVIAGTTNHFFMEYECSSPTEKRWFSLRGSPFQEAAPRRAVIAHADITERKLAEERLRRQFEGQRLLSEFSKRLIDLPNEDAESVMSDILDAISLFLGADRAYVFQLEQDGVTVHQVYGFSQPHLPEHLRFAVDACRASLRVDDAASEEPRTRLAMMLEHLRPDRPLVVPNTAALDDDSPGRQMFDHCGIRSLMAIPMVEGNRVMGFLGIDTIEKERTWSEDDRGFLQSFVELLTTATSRWRSEELLRSIVEGVSASADNTSFLSVLVEQICRGLKVHYAFIAELVGNGEARTLAFVGPNGSIPPAVLPLTGTPAVEIVERGGQWIFRKDVQATFPDDEMLRRFGIESYAGVPLCDASGRVIGFMAIMHKRHLGGAKLVVDVMRAFAARAASEIDRRHKDEALLALNHALELRVAERAAVAARQAAAMDATTEGMAIMEGEMYVYMNDAHAQMFGYESGRMLLGHSWRELFSSDECERIDSDVRPVLLYEHKFRGQFIGKRCNGSTFDVHLALNLTERGDIICCCEDITEQKRIQSELAAHRDELRIANIELSSAVQLKDEFLASMSHELRTPLNAILGMTEILLEEMVGALNDKQVSFLRIVDESGKHLLSLINDILDLSKIEAGKLALEFSMVDVRTVCEAGLRLVKPAADAKKHKLNLNCPANLERIRVDERRLKQMLVNLLDNALKFTREGGTMGIDVEQDLERGTISFSVWDTGIGIAGEHIPQLFKPFSQLEHGLAKQHAGTGLGLSLVKRLAEMHGGSVSVETTIGVGSRFTVSLPHAPRTTYTESSPPSSYHTQRMNLLPPGMSCTVLVVDDNLSNLQMLRDYLVLKGYNILTAQSGPEALDVLETTTIHAVLMDIQMPGMDGLEVIRILRRDQRYADLPIIAVTALAMTGDRERCLTAGATEYAPKPLSPRQVAISLARLLHS